ncbi:MAG: ATP-dependent Clp protease ATP-binding subunit [bacterium]|nr:ATP-dependent Clp protease ATP-binding subunit [bacterium]
MLNADFLQRFTTHLRDALQKALAFTVQSGRTQIEPGDLLVGLLQEKGCLAAEILQKAHMTLEHAKETFRGSSSPHLTGGTIAPDLSPAVKRLLEKCILTAHLYEHKYVGTEHLLFALLETPLPDVHAFFQSSSTSLDLVKQEVLTVLKSISKFPDLSLRVIQGGEENEESAGDDTSPQSPVPQNAGPSRSEKRPKAIDVFTRDLTAIAYAHGLDPVIGRDEETNRVIEILCRRMKNNPILLGDPGVGKTAIVEGLAQRLISDDVPDLLLGRRILAVDLALLVAGTMYRGEFEARMKQLVEEVRVDKSIILFIDEIHTLVGAGSTSGSLDAANILKPALARGEIRCIGATTWNEYKKYIEPDAALERRYQVVDVQEPDAKTTRRMLDGLKRRYEEHHGVTYEPAALASAVSFGERYLTDRFFPDKAIDLLDEAAALVNARRAPSDAMERLRSLEIAIHAARELKDTAVSEKSLDEAAKALKQEQTLLNEKSALEESIKQKRDAQKLTVTRDHIAEIVARASHVPISTILAKEQEQLIHLEEEITATIVGQEAAVQTVSEAVRHARLGLSDPRRPKASFLFVGPSGVGKTEMARALAKHLFGREEALVKLDMSEFSESHSISKLLGSPAGYVGFRDGNRLLDTLRKHPHAVLLFDEFEKAHPDVQHVLLQILEDGQLTEATGRHISFRHAYIILTSNVGADFLHRTKIGFDSAPSKSAYEALTRDALTDRFRPELLNRLDRIVVFQPLGKRALKKILRRELHLVFSRLREAQQVAYSANDDVLSWLMEKEWRVEEGARAARRLVEREVAPLLGLAVGKPSKTTKHKLKVSKNKLIVQ